MSPILLIKMKDGTIYEDKLPLHIFIIEKYNLNIDDVKEVGFKVKGNRIIWDVRKPH